ncbi:MAG TPA: heavy metal-binding domain-containing protein [Acetobacteraceae bacterium]|nr:heavy metal-binding domain-containing protein [Acetobacteraceae bacterium]
MILTTTSSVEGREVERHLGIVFGDAVLGVNVFKDFLGSMRDFVGGRSATYERELGNARDTALRTLVEQAQALGADAVIGLDLDYEVLGGNGGMLMVSASGTAVKLRSAAPGAQPRPWG